MKIKVFQGGYDKNLCYLLWCEESLRAAIIDPSVEPLEIFEYIENNDLFLEKILITHTHHDHIAFLDDFIFKFPNLKVFGYKESVKKNINNYIGITNREIINVGKNILTAIYTPGHYPDSICYWNIDNKCIFTGDTMFVGRTGRTISSGSSIEELFNSIYFKLLKLSNSTRIYPGHNYGFSKSCTIQENIQYSPFFQCKTLAEFKIVMDNYERNRK
tara:strand:- start:108 stop:755 length:648 start_codon:yes stop_codon:yes gene_type:complete